MRNPPSATLLVGILFATFLSFRPAIMPAGPAPEPRKIKWMTIQEAYALNQKTPKKFVIDVYTDWCGWCKEMDKKTFTNAAVVDFINEHYYAVKLNAEQKEDIKLGDRTYKSLGSAHELAAGLLQNRMSYPTTVFMTEKFEVIQPVPGYLEPKTFHQIATYFGGDYFRKEPFEQFKTGTYVKEYQAAMQ